VERTIATKSTWVNDTTARGLLEKAGQGDEAALAELKSHLKDRPRDWEGICLLVGDMAKQAERSLIKAAAGSNLLLLDAIRVKLDHMEAELLGPAPTPLERLLVQRIRASWLQLSYAENIYAQSMEGLTLVGEWSRLRSPDAWPHTAVVVIGSGEIVTSDPRASALLVLSPEGEPVREIPVAVSEGVERLQPDALHGEEVARDHPGRLLVKELSPRRAAPGGRTETGTAKDHGYSGRRDLHPALQEFPTNPHVAPPGGRCGLVHFLLANCRCHRSSVSGRTRNAPHASRGSVLLAAARNALSEVR